MISIILSVSHNLIFSKRDLYCPEDVKITGKRKTILQEKTLLQDKNVVYNSNWI